MRVLCYEGIIINRIYLACVSECNANKNIANDIRLLINLKP